MYRNYEEFWDRISTVEEDDYDDEKVNTTCKNGI